MEKTVILAMSGGVDSSIALYLLIEMGYSVRGLTMQNRYLSSEELSKAEQTAKLFNIEWEVLHVEKEFEEMVINPFLNAYKKGLTPNPCAICNKNIKFGLLFEIMQKRYPHSFYATGHYAIIKKEDGRYFIQEARDKKKDQSYFLGLIKPDILNQLIFPIGDFQKAEIINLAKKLGLVSDNVSESQDICFIHDTDYKSFLLCKGIREKKGEIVNENNELLGVHQGIFNFTIGQRRGLGISANQRLFVKEILPETNTIKLAPLKNMYTQQLKASKLNRFASREHISELSKKMLKCKVKSGRQQFDCQVKLLGDEMIVCFKDDVFAVTPGQLCVIYNDEGLIMISGMIQKASHKNGTIK